MSATSGGPRKPRHPGPVLAVLRSIRIFCEVRIDRDRARTLYCLPKMATTRSKKRAASAPANPDWLTWIPESPDELDSYWVQSRGLALSLVLIAPLILAYEIALVFYAKPTGAGRFLKSVFYEVFHNHAGMILNVIVAMFVLLAIFVLARRRRLRLTFIVPMVMESALWAVVLVLLAIVICQRLPNVQLNIGGSATTAFANVISSIGAGVYEEILFRLGLTSAVFIGVSKLLKQRPAQAAGWAAVISAAAFACCHILPWEEPFNQQYIWFYLLFYFSSGVFFSLLYTFRGLGVAVYTHVIYDVVVLLTNK